MPVMVFLKFASEAALLLTAGGAMAFHFGAGVWQIVVTLIVIGLTEVLSYLIYTKTGDESRAGRFLRVLVMIIPFVCILLPGFSIAWAVLCGVIWLYAVFLAVTARYMSESDHFKTVFKIAIGLTVGVVIILLFASATETSFSLTIFSGMVSLACSILLMRSLRHDISVYSSASFQLINVGLVAAVAAVILLLSSNVVISSILSVIKTVYTFIAEIALKVIMWLVEGIGKFIEWLKTIMTFHEIPQQEREVIELNTDSGAGAFGYEDEYVGTPLGVKIAVIAIAALVVAFLLFLIFRYIAGQRAARQKGEAAGVSDRGPLRPRQRRAEDEQSEVRGVRKQYKRYLHFLRKEGMYIDPSDTSADIVRTSPEPYQSQEAIELRGLYLEARYNNRADERAADRAKELVRIIRKGEA